MPAFFPPRGTAVFFLLISLVPLFFPLVFYTMCCVGLPAGRVRMCFCVCERESVGRCMFYQRHNRGARTCLQFLSVVIRPSNIGTRVCCTISASPPKGLNITLMLSGCHKEIVKEWHFKTLGFITGRGEACVFCVCAYFGFLHCETSNSTEHQPANEHRSVKRIRRVSFSQNALCWPMRLPYAWAGERPTFWRTIGREPLSTPHHVSTGVTKLQLGSWRSDN